jgi:hypothetical protein
MLVLYVSITLLLYVAVSGLMMVVGIVRGARPWVPLAAGHGVLAATAILLALWAAIATRAAAIGYGVAILVLTALGGLVLLGSHLRGKPYPWMVIVLHAVCAVGGVGCLVFALFR